LHAKELGITHPNTGEKLFFDSEVPNDMQAVLNKWRKYAIDKILE
jgi:23S rRNA pseudouridine1911/1915/1917 synthase